mmetsp:Transcript_25838/g.65707  ORF Transcript_25838/g.65707 Transcript_25838/m.65707 type:complete len:253 (+) Transcript_25838:2298-3056(+)
MGTGAVEAQCRGVRRACTVRNSQLPARPTARLHQACTQHSTHSPARTTGSGMSKIGAMQATQCLATGTSKCNSEKVVRAAGVLPPRWRAQHRAGCPASACTCFGSGVEQQQHTPVYPTSQASGCAQCLSPANRSLGHMGGPRFAFLCFTINMQSFYAMPACPTTPCWSPGGLATIKPGLSAVGDEFQCCTQPHTATDALSAYHMVSQPCGMRAWGRTQVTADQQAAYHCVPQAAKPCLSAETVCGARMPTVF